jgi:hypothetical protein
MSIPSDIDNRLMIFDAWLDAPEDERPVDRYSIIIDGDLDSVLAASAFPFHPQGFGQHCSGASWAWVQRELDAKRRITFSQLPEQVQKFVMQDVTAIDREVNT